MDVFYRKKQQDDLLLTRVHDFLSKNTIDKNERAQLTQQLLSTQQENNEKIINKQKIQLESLGFKCNQLEKENGKENKIELDLMIKIIYFLYFFSQINESTKKQLERGDKRSEKYNLSDEQTIQ